MAIQLLIGGADFTAFQDFRTITVETTQEIKGSTLGFDLKFYDAAFPLLTGQEVVFLDGGSREFGGAIVRSRETQGEGNREVTYVCLAIGYTYYLDRRYLNKVYDSQRADLMIGEALDDLKNAADNDSSAGDQHYTDFQGDKTQLSTGPVIRQQLAERMLPSQFFDQIAEAAGMIWFINVDKQVVLKELQAAEAPLPKVNGRPVLDIDSLTEDNRLSYSRWSEEEDITGTGTKTIMVDTTIKSSAVIIDKFVWNTGDDTKFILSRRPFSFLDITGVTLDSVTATQKLEDVDREASDDTDSGTTPKEVYIFISDTSYVRFATGDLVNGDAIEVTYNYRVSDDHEALAAEEREELAERTGGDGVHEFLFTQASGIAVESPQDLDEIQEILLGRKALIHRRGDFTSYLKGWEPGQIFDRIRSSKASKFSDSDELMYVIAVTKRVETPADDPNIGDNWIRSEIEYSNIPRGIVL